MVLSIVNECFSVTHYKFQNEPRQCPFYCFPEHGNCHGMYQHMQATWICCARGIDKVTPHISTVMLWLILTTVWILCFSKHCTVKAQKLTQKQTSTAYSICNRPKQPQKCSCGKEWPHHFSSIYVRPILILFCHTQTSSYEQEQYLAHWTVCLNQYYSVHNNCKEFPTDSSTA